MTPPEQPIGKDASAQALSEIRVMLRAGKRAEALELLRSATALIPEAADSADALAYFARQLNEHVLSRRLYQHATALAPREARFWYNLATSERALGDLAAAAAACDRALALEPGMFPAVLLRSELSRATPADNRVELLETMIRPIAGRAEAVPLLYALGKERHELGE